MVNFDESINAYQQVMNSEKYAEEVKDSVRKYIAAMEILNHKTDDELYEIFDTGVFNEIVVEYVRMAMINCKVDEKMRGNVCHELYRMFDEKNAAEIMSVEH